MDKIIYPSKLKGSIKIPASKSILHRSIICAALAGGISKIDNVVYSKDICATMEAVEAMGANIYRGKDYILIEGIELDQNINKSYGYIDKNCSFSVAESGSTLRFLLPILSLIDRNFSIYTEGRLIKRPLDIYLDIFDREGIAYDIGNGSINIQGGMALEGGVYNIDGSVSSQFVSGMMFALPLIDRDSTINILGELESKSYVDMTISTLKDFGVEIQNHDYKSFSIVGRQKYRAREYYVEGDYSQAAFFAVANALGSEVDIYGINENSLQGDREILDILEHFGAELEFRNSDEGVYLHIREGERRAYSFDGKDIPDIVPILSLLAALSDGQTHISNISRLKIKESDRLDAVYRELSALGADIEKGEDYLKIKGKNMLKGGCKTSSHRDHRIAMMLAIAASKCHEPIEIEYAEAVSKSYPEFWNDIESLGGRYECNMGEEF